MEIYEVILIITWIISTIKYLGHNHPLPSFYLFITLVLMIELFIEHYYSRIYGNNLMILNYYSKICVYYYLYVFGKYFNLLKWARLYVILVIIYVATTQIYFFNTMQIQEFDGVSYLIGMIILLPLIFKYFYSVIYDKDYYNLFTDPYFFLAIGILIYFTSAFPILTFINVLVTHNSAFEAYVLLINLGNIFLSLAYLGVTLCPMIPKPSTI